MLQSKHNHHHKHGRCQRKWPLTPQMRPYSPQQCVILQMGNDPPSKRVSVRGGGFGGAWPSKRSFVPALMHRRNIGVFLGPHTPSTFEKLFPLARGVFPHQGKRTASGERRPHVDRKWTISAGVGHGRLWLRWSLLAVGGW